MADKKKWEIDRRTFLKGALGGAGSLMGLPVLEAMLPSIARAQALGFGEDRNFIALYKPLGCARPKFFPSQFLSVNTGTFTGSQWNLSHALAGLQDHKSLLNVYAGIGCAERGNDHHEEGLRFLTCLSPALTDTCGNKKINVGSIPGQGKSMDQIIADHFNQIGSPFKTDIHSLQLSSNDHPNCQDHNVISFQNSDTPLWGSRDVVEVFKTLFLGFNPGASQQTADARTIRRRNILDEVNQSAKSLRGKLGYSDRITMERYLTSVESLQKNISDISYDGNTGPSCKVPAEPGAIPSAEGNPLAANYKDHIHTMMDLIVLALECGRTRVASYMLSTSGFSYNWRDIIPDSELPDYPDMDMVKYFLGLNYHELSHYHSVAHPTQGRGVDNEKVQEASYNAMNTICRWYLDRANYLVTKLKAANLMDKTLIYYGSGLGDAEHHWPYAMPIVTIGNAKGMQTNMFQVFQKYEMYDSYKASVAKLMVNIMNSYGVTGVNINNFGLRAGEDPLGFQRKVLISSFGV